MKALIAFSILVFSLGAHASNISGRAELTMWSQGAGGMMSLDIRQEGSKIIGHTFYGNSGIVNLEVANGKYIGFAGGDAATNLVCNNRTCDGMIAGHAANFTTSNTQDRKKGAVVKTVGSSNFHSVEITRSAKDIEFVNRSNTLTLRRVRAGVYEGDAYLFTAWGIRSYTARLTASGTLANLPDDEVLSTIFLAASLDSGN